MAKHKRPGKTTRPKLHAVRKPAGKAAKRKAPKPQRLAGMDIARDPVLDSICSSLEDVYTTINEQSAEKKGLLARALPRMKLKRLESYVAHHIRITRLQGEEKISVKLVDSDEGGNVEVEKAGGDEPGNTAGEGAGELTPGSEE